MRVRVRLPNRWNKNREGRDQRKLRDWTMAPRKRTTIKFVYPVLKEEVKRGETNPIWGGNAGEDHKTLWSVERKAKLLGVGRRGNSTLTNGYWT